MDNNSLFNAFARSFEVRSETDMSMAEYLESCRGDPMRYANAAERLLAAIGEPQMIDTAKDARLGRIFLNRTLRAYPAFTGFEKPAGITNPKDFRNEVVKFSLRSRAQNSSKNPSWTSYEKIREVIEKRIFSQVEDLLPVISFGSKKDGDTEKKHGEFVARMVGRGYTERQVRRLVEWYMRVKQAG